MQYSKPEDYYKTLEGAIMSWGDYPGIIEDEIKEPVFSDKYFTLLKLCGGRFVLQPVFLGYIYKPLRYCYSTLETYKDGRMDNNKAD
jgi:hypothetical protein